MDLCSSFLKDTSVNPINKTPLTKEQQLEFINLCGFGRDKDITIETFMLKCKDIINSKFDSCMTRQEKGSLENIKLWFISQLNYLKKIRDEDDKLISFYEKSGMFEWNNVLRGILDPCNDIKDISNKDKTPNKFKEEFEVFYKIISQAPQTPNIIVYRGETYDDFDIFNTPYSKDGKIMNKGFLSTSLDMNQAVKYSLYKMVNGKQENNKNKKTLLQIEIPAGTPALFIGLRKYPNIDVRFEIVLPPNILRYIEDLNTISYPFGDGEKQFINVKRFKVETILPSNFSVKGIYNTLTEDIIINEIFQRLKEDETIWEVNGVYGMNLLLKHRYKLQNLIPVNTIYLKGYYKKKNKDDKNELIMTSKISEIINEILQKYNIPKTKIIKYIEDLGNTLIYSIKYETCPTLYEDVIKIEYTEDYIYKSNVDIEIYNKIKLPIKTALGYSQEVQDILNKKEVHSDFTKKDKEQLEHILNLLKKLSP